MTAEEFTTEELAVEEWKTVPDFPAYEISNLGRIRRRTACRASAAGRILVPCPASNGYSRISLVKGKAYTFSIHRLVAMVWLGDAPFPGSVVNHKNGVKTDNRASNLEWCSHIANVRHSIEVLGKTRDGDDSPNAKLTVAKVLEIHEAMMSGTPPATIMATFGIGETQLARIKQRKCWKTALRDLPNNYPIPERLIRGSRVGTARLVESQVAQIKNMIRANLTNDQIAAQFGVSRSTIQFIRCGQTWKHVP